jgi:hypothetical protein
MRDGPGYFVSVIFSRMYSWLDLLVAQFGINIVFAITPNRFER